MKGINTELLKAIEICELALSFYSNGIYCPEIANDAIKNLNKTELQCLKIFNMEENIKRIERGVKNKC